MRSVKLGLFVITLLALAAGFVSAGTIIQMEKKALDPSAQDGEGTLYLESNRARIEFKSGDEYGILIYTTEDKDNPRLWLIDQTKFTYIEVEKKDMQKVRGKILDQMEMFEAQIKQMPPEQRDQIMAQFGDQMKQMRKIAEPRDKSKYSFKKGESAKVGDYSTNQVKCFYDEELEDEAWIASWDDVGLAHEDVKILTTMEEAFGALTGLGFLANLLAVGDVEGVSGFPVRTVSYESGEEQDETLVAGVHKVDIDPQKFVLPKGLDKQPFMQ